MIAQFILQLTFYNGHNEISLYWLPERQVFTFAQPRAVISASDLEFEKAHAEQHARQVLGKEPFHLYAHDLSLCLDKAARLARRLEGGAHA